MAAPAQTPARLATRNTATSVLRRWFYLGMSLLIAAVVIYGFSQTVDHKLIHATPVRPWLLWVHGGLFSGWVAFFVLQTALVRSRNVPIHRALGWFGAGLASAMTVVGCGITVVMGRWEMARLHDASFVAFLLIVSFWDISCFTVLFWLAVVWRKKPELHRRLMLMATCVLTSAAFARFPWEAFSDNWFYAGVDALILLGVLRDLIVNRSVHKVYRYALPVLVVGQIFVVRTYLSDPAWWMHVVSAIVH